MVDSNIPLRQQTYKFDSTGQKELRTTKRIRSLLISNRGGNNLTVFLGDAAEPNGVVVAPSTTLSLTVFDLYAADLFIIRFSGTSGDNFDVIWVQGQSGLDAFLLSVMGRR